MERADKDPYNGLSYFLQALGDNPYTENNRGFGHWLSMWLSHRASLHPFLATKQSRKYFSSSFLKLQQLVGWIWLVSNSPTNSIQPTCKPTFFVHCSFSRVQKVVLEIPRRIGGLLFGKQTMVILGFNVLPKHLSTVSLSMMEGLKILENTVPASHLDLGLL